MEDQDNLVHNLRSRSRSKTPLPLSGDQEQSNSQRLRNTPLHFEGDIIEEETEPEIFISPPAHRTRNALKNKTPIVTSDESHVEVQETYLSREELQNIKNYSYEYEHMTISQNTLACNGSRIALDTDKDGSRVHSSLSGSDISNESFAESVLADSSRLSVEDGMQHLPYRVYKCAVEYWNKYPKTDYTYSRLSKDRVELAPGQIAVPNMSRPSLHSVRHNFSSLDHHTASTTSDLLTESDLRQRWLSNTNSYQSSRVDSMSDSEVDEIDNWRRTKQALKKNERWKVTQWLISTWTIIKTWMSSVYYGDKSSRYRATTNYYTYSSLQSNQESKFSYMKKKRVWIPLLLLLLLLPLAYYWWLHPSIIFWETTQKSDEVKIMPIGQRENKWELTEDMINQIVIRVKESIPPVPTPEPVIVEKIIETKIVPDDQLMREQQQLIDKLSADILALKNKDNSIDESLLSNMISSHVTNTIIQILGLRTTNQHEIKDELLSQQRDYIDSQMSGIKAAIKSDLNTLDYNIRQHIEKIQSQQTASSVGGGVVYSESSQTGCQCDEMIRKIVNDALLIYDADKTGLVDYAMESAGGQVISIRCTQQYQLNTAVLSLFGIPLWYPSNTPRTIITPGATPGACWAFQGFPGYLVIKLFKRVRVTGFTLEHVSSLLSPHGQIESAPKVFTVWGLQNEMDENPHLFGMYEYRNDTTPIQHFKVEHDDVNGHNSVYPGHDIVELRIESNHGNPLYTCLYRFRVHGDPIDDIYFKENVN